MSKDGALFHWNYCRKPGIDIDPDSVDDGERWRIIQRHYFMQTKAKVKCAAFHAVSNLLVVGFSNGLFGLYELPEFTMIHTLR